MAFSTDPISLANDYSRMSKSLEAAVEAILDSIELYCDEADLAKGFDKIRHERHADMLGKASFILINRLNAKQRRLARFAG